MSEPASSSGDKWREIIERQQASGLSAAAFCRQDGVSESSFFAWKRRLGAPTAAAAAAFVEAKVATAAVAPAGRPAGVVEVRLRGGRRVRLGRGFDPGLLAEVVVALEALS